jgi:hypothetical protein
MERDIFGGTNPSGLDAGDDTNDSASDFMPAQPTPLPNAGIPPTPHSRSVTLGFPEPTVARGRVRVADEFSDCASEVTVKFQRKSSGVWKTLKTKTTGTGGGYRMTVEKRPGKYRTVAPSFVYKGTDLCRKAVSAVRERG